jgi:hypothetical protein
MKPEHKVMARRMLADFRRYIEGKIAGTKFETQAELVAANQLQSEIRRHFELIFRGLLADDSSGWYVCEGAPSFSGQDKRVWHADFKQATEAEANSLLLLCESAKPDRKWTVRFRPRSGPFVEYERPRAPLA